MTSFKLESLFRQLTPNVNLQGINLSGITQKAITVSDILSNFDLIVAEAIIKPDNHVRKDPRKAYVALATHGRVGLILRMNGSDRM